MWLLVQKVVSPFTSMVTRPLYPTISRCPCILNKLLSYFFRHSYLFKLSCKVTKKFSKQREKSRQNFDDSLHTYTKSLKNDRNDDDGVVDMSQIHRRVYTDEQDLPVSKVP